MRNKRFSDEAAVAAHQNVKEKEYWLERLSGANTEKSVWELFTDNLRALRLSKSRN